jgi:hypothetical protein
MVLGKFRKSKQHYFPVLILLLGPVLNIVLTHIAVLQAGMFTKEIQLTLCK